MSKPLSDIAIGLLQAKELIMLRGWRQGLPGRLDGPVCLGDALYLTNSYDLVKDQVGSIPGWNDQPGRTVEDVMALLDGLLEAEFNKGELR